jgi:hypothetical protein
MFTKKNCELVVWVMLALMAKALHAQSTSATMTGFILDQSSAIISNAAVTLTNVNNGATASVHSNGAGLYRIQGLLPGTYRANVSAEGFKSLVKDGIDLHLEDEVSMNFTLGVGSVTETVTVESGNELIEATSPTVSQVIEGQQVEDAPLNGRNVMNLVALTPGVVPQGASQGSVTQNQLGGFFTNSFGWGNYQIGGGLAGQSSEYLDGAPLNILYGHTSALVPTQDAIQEFRVESSVANVRYGAYGGGVVSFATKSGTNEFHGTAYEFLRNTVLDSNSFFNNLLDQPRPSLIQNQFGADVGGRIIRDKAFGFFSYEGFRQILQIPNAGRIPTPAELSGDFTNDPPIYDPTTGHQFECNNVLNMICPGRFDPTATIMANTIHYWPTPNTNSPAINYSRNGSAGSNNDQYNARVDWSVGKQKLFGRYTYWNAYQKPTQFFFGTNGPSSGPSVSNDSKQIVLGDTYVLSSSTIVDAHISYLRYVTGVTPDAENVDLSEFGPFYAAIANQVTAKTYPNVIVSGTVGQPYNFLNVLNGSPFNNYAFSGTLTHLVGRHSLLFGGEGRRQEQYFNQTISPTGFYVFGGIFTACAAFCTTPAGVPSTPTPAGGGATPIADFLLGNITASPLGFTELIFPSMVSNYGGVFASDTYKAGSKFTLTYGVRWEMPGGFTEKHNRNTVLLPQLANPLVLVDSTAYPSRSDLQAHRALFSPRVGVAFGPRPSSVFRVGYSLSFLPQDSVYDAASSSPIIAATTFVASGAAISAPLGVGNNTLLEPTGRAYDGTQFLGTSISSRIPNQHFPYMQQWSGDYQQAFGSRTSLDLGYLGNRTEHLAAGELSIDINQIPDQFDGMPAGSLSQSDRPYPEYQAVNAISPFVGQSNYNSLQATLKRQFSAGGTLLANYTWSRFIGNSEAATAFVEQYSVGAIQDYTNLRGEISRLSFDTPQRLVISYVLDLPFGHGKRFLPSATSITQGILGGWNVSGITTFASGFPLAISAAANTLSNVYGAGTIRPNYVAGCTKSISESIVTAAQNSSPLLNQACFTQPGDTSFGNEPRVDPSLRAQGQDNWDFALAKKTTIHDQLNLEFRVEAFNIANRVQFGSPNTTSGGALFGVISAQNNNPRVLQFSLRTNF